jgi:hypothetical protein
MNVQTSLSTYAVSRHFVRSSSQPRFTNIRFFASFLNVASSIIFMLSAMLLSGFYSTQIPSWIYWLAYFSFAKYTFGLLIQIQFLPSYVRFECARVSRFAECEPDGLGYIPGTAVLELFGHTSIPWWGNMMMMFTLICGVRMLAYITLRYNTRRTKG